MNKTLKYLSFGFVLLSGIFLSTTSAYADIAGPSLGLSSDSTIASILIIFAGVVVGAVVSVSILIIRLIRRKKNVINK